MVTTAGVSAVVGVEATSQGSRPSPRNNPTDIGDRTDRCATSEHEGRAVAQVRSDHVRAARGNIAHPGLSNLVMRRVPSGSMAVLCLGFAACQAAPPRPAAGADSVLPLRSVRLYENGVGYFEREGMLGEHGAALGVPASHVDDALKTMLVLSRGQSTVSGIEFPSVVSDGAARSLAGLSLEGENPADYEHVLRSMTGFRVEIVGDKGPLVRGRLLDVERTSVSREATAPASGKGESSDAAPAPIVYQLLVVGDAGEIVRVPSTTIRTLRPLDPEFSARLQTAVDALGGRSAQLSRELRVRASAKAPIRIGYIAETPVWRASYRLVLPLTGPTAMLEGWALVHNDTDEAWTSVAVELVNGAPDSFLFPMAAPRYARRALATPETELSTVPQLALRTADGLWGDHVDETSAGGLGITGIGEGGGGYGEGIGLGSIGTLGHGVGAADVAAKAITIGDLSQIASAKGKDEGRLFSYRLAQPVSLRAHGSSLLPLLAHDVAIQRFTRFESDDAGRAAVRFRNDSPYILPDGPIAMFEPAGFSGETIVHRMLPAETAFLQYGFDLDETLHATQEELSRSVVHVVWNARTARLEQSAIAVTAHRLDIENHAPTPRTAGYVLSGVGTNAKVEGADELDYDSSAGHAIAFVTVPSGQSMRRTLRVTEARSTATALSALTTDTVEQLSTSNSLPARERAILKAALPAILALTEIEKVAHDLEHHESELDADLERNRQHLQAMQASQGGSNPIAARIVALEQARDAGRRNLAAAREKVAASERAATRALEGLKAAPAPS